MHEDIADIVGMRFTNEVERVDAELAKEKKATDARNAAKGIHNPAATYRADIERCMARAERLSTFLMNTWVGLIRRKQGTFTSEDVSFVYGEVCHFMASTPAIQAPVGTSTGTAQALREELTRQTIRLQSSINRNLQLMHREEALPQRAPEQAAMSRSGGGKQGKTLVFISCGQYQPKERGLGANIAKLADEFGFDGYFAQNQSSVGALTANVFKKLRDAAALVVVMHPRGEVKGLGGATHIRGSVWIEQEIAIAAFLQHVEEHELKVAAFVHKDLEHTLEGVREKVQLNPITFEDEQEVLNHLRRIFHQWRTPAKPAAS